VLTFDLSDQTPPREAKVCGEGTCIDGEIVVSLDTATRQADKLGHSVAAELALYAVHGILHLLEYNDDSPANTERMHEVEDEILGSLGLGSIYRGSAK
jgi:probable rRNA maturation factor